MDKNTKTFKYWNYKGVSSLFLTSLFVKYFINANVFIISNVIIFIKQFKKIDIMGLLGINVFINNLGLIIKRKIKYNNIKTKIIKGILKITRGGE